MTDGFEGKAARNRYFLFGVKSVFRAIKNLHKKTNDFEVVLNTAVLQERQAYSKQLEGKKRRDIRSNRNKPMVWGAVPTTNKRD